MAIGVTQGVAKMASHAIFQYNVLAINDTHNTWTNMIVKMTILRLLGSSDNKEKIGVARAISLSSISFEHYPYKSQLALQFGIKDKRRHKL